MARGSTLRRTSTPTIKALAADARRCRNCELWEHATQVVFGEGPSLARIVLVAHLQLARTLSEEG